MPAAPVPELRIEKRRTPKYDITGKPGAFAVMGRNLTPGIESNELLAVVWGEDVADLVVPALQRAAQVRRDGGTEQQAVEAAGGAATPAPARRTRTRRGAGTPAPTGTPEVITNPPPVATTSPA